MNKHILTKLQAVALLAIILSGVGCYAVWRFAEPKAYFQVWGDVTLNAPLVGAKISILDQDGKTLATQQNATYTTGAFYFDIPLGMFQLNYALPSGLRIVAEGGTLNDEAFTGKATLIVPEYTNEGYYKVNAITTLAAAYHDKHPEITYAKTQATVETFLKVPDGVTLNNVISTSEWDDSVFSHTVFMWQANAAGGFNEFVNSLVTEIDQGKTHPITNELLFGWEWIDLGCWIGKSIAGGAVSSVAGAGVNWVLHNLGFRNPTEKMVEQLRDQMNVMQQNISTILTSVKKIESLQQATLQRIDDAVKQIGTKIDLAYKGLKWEVELSALKVRSSNLVSAIREPKETITTTFNRLYEYSKLDPANIDESFRNTVNKTVDEILSPIIGIEPKLMAIHDSIVGSLDEGLLDVWTSILTLAAPDKAQLESLFNTFMERFSYLLTLELMGANLMIDAYHAKFGDDTKLAKNFWASWKEKMENQLDLFLSFAERTAVSRIDTLTVSEFNNPNFFSKSSEGSTILQRSDEFYQEMMSSLEAEQNTRKTISLRVVNFPNVTSQKLPAEANIKLLNVNTGTAYSPSVTEFRNGTTVHDWEFTTANYEIAYFAFTVPPGSYRATTQTPALLREYDTLQNITWTATDQGSRWPESVRPSVQRCRRSAGSASARIQRAPTNWLAPARHPAPRHQTRSCSSKVRLWTVGTAHPRCGRRSHHSSGRRDRSCSATPCPRHRSRRYRMERSDRRRSARTHRLTAVPPTAVPHSPSMPSAPSSACPDRCPRRSASP